MEKPTWTHQKSLNNRLQMEQYAVILGEYPEDLTGYGTLEDMIKGDAIYKSMGADITYVSDTTLTSSRFFVMVSIKSQSEEKVKEYVVKVELMKEESGKYRIQRTEETEHTCDNRAFQKSRKILPLPSCKHAIAAVEAVHDKLTRAIEDAKEDIEIVSYYSERDLLPVSDELIDFYKTIKNEKQVEKFKKLYSFFHSDKKVFRF